MRASKFIIKLSLKILVLLAIIGLTVYGNYLIIGQITKIDLAMKQKKEINYLLQNRAEIGSQISAALATTDKNYEAKIINALPSVYNILPFVEALNSLADKNSLQQNLNFSQPVSVDGANTPLSLLKIDFNANFNNGNIGTFTAYLKDLEKLPYFNEVIALSLSGDKGWQNNSALILNGQFYARQ